MSENPAMINDAMIEKAAGALAAQDPEFDPEWDYRPAARAALTAALPLILEEAAKRCDAWDDPQALRLAAGEMTAQEMRTARAVARGLGRAIRAMREKANG